MVAEEVVEEALQVEEAEVALAEAEGLEEDLVLLGAVVATGEDSEEAVEAEVMHLTEQSCSKCRKLNASEEKRTRMTRFSGTLEAGICMEILRRNM